VEQLTTINQRLSEVLSCLERVNAVVNRHEQWIVDRERICMTTYEAIDQLRQHVQGHQSFIDQQKGGLKATGWIANAIGAVFGAALVLLGHYLERPH
jgi:hypothetical protein